MDDIKLCYFGGSGGFIVLHLLLLSKRFTCVFKNGKVLDDVIKDQWSIDNPSVWKKNECWPNNVSTYHQVENSKKKIYFFCNPSIEEVSKYPGKCVFLYTDSISQIRLAQYKIAYIYAGWPNRIDFYRQHIRSWRTHYNNIKDIAWPECSGPKKFKRLPNYIQVELLTHPYTGYLLDIPTPTKDINIDVITRMSAYLSNGDLVLQDVFDFIKHANVTIKLQDIINRPELLSELTGTTVTQEQLDLRNKWLDLHPRPLLASIGILEPPNRPV